MLYNNKMYIRSLTIFKFDILIPRGLCEVSFPKQWVQPGVEIRGQRGDWGIRGQVGLYIKERSLKGTVRPDGSAWECYHWIGLEKDINRYIFLTFQFQFWIFKRTSKFWAASCKKASNPPAFLVHGLHVLKPQSFRRTVLQKCGRDINCSLDCCSQVKNSIIPQSKPK